MTDQVQIQPGYPQWPFTATLPDGTVWRSAIVLPRPDFQVKSDEWFEEEAQRRAEAQWLRRTDPELERAVQEARELVELIEERVQVEATGEINLQIAFTSTEPGVGDLLAALANRGAAAFQEPVEERLDDPTYGPLWQQFLSQFE